MGAYSYEALDERGRTVKGVLEADTARLIRQQLRDKGLTPLDVQEVAQRANTNKAGSAFRRGMNATELALFTRQLATLVRSGLPLEQSLKTVAEQTEVNRIQSIILGLRARVVEGRTLAAAVREFPNIFPPLFPATIDAGEQSGKLDLVLERLADYVEDKQALQKNISAQLAYPAILVLLSVGIVGFLLASVVPQVVGVFDTLEAELPPLTRGLIAISDFLRDNAVLLGVGLVALLFFANQALKNDAVLRRWHRFLLRMPIAGRLNRGLNTGRFTRTFSILVSSGVPVLDSMKICAQVVTNLPMREAIEDAALRVREGSNVHRALAESKLFPPITLNLIANGESSGQLNEMLERAADNQEREVNTLLTTLVGILGPLLIVAMAGLVLMIVLSIMLPIFDLNQLVR